MSFSLIAIKISSRYERQSGCGAMDNSKLTNQNFVGFRCCRHMCEANIVGSLISPDATEAKAQRSTSRRRLFSLAATLTLLWIEQLRFDTTKTTASRKYVLKGEGEGYQLMFSSPRQKYFCSFILNQLHKERTERLNQSYLAWPSCSASFH